MQSAQEHHGPRLNEQVFTGRVLAQPMAPALKLGPGSAVVEARRNYLLADGSLALAAITIHPADHFRHAMVLRRARG